MFSLFALQIALTRVWVQSLAGFEASCPAEFGDSRAEQRAAAAAGQELDRIVRAHSFARRYGAVHD